MGVLPYLAVVLVAYTESNDDRKIRNECVSHVSPHLATTVAPPEQSVSLPGCSTRRTCAETLRSNKCYQHAAFAPPSNEPAEKRCQPRGGNCPEAMQPPHSSADRATSIHEPCFQLGASFTRTRTRFVPTRLGERISNFKVTVSICEIFERLRKKLLRIKGASRASSIALQGWTRTGAN